MWALALGLPCRHPADTSPFRRCGNAKLCLKFAGAAEAEGLLEPHHLCLGEISAIYCPSLAPDSKPAEAQIPSGMVGAGRIYVYIVRYTVCVCISNLLILPHTDPTGSWRQLVPAIF